MSNHPTRYCHVCGNSLLTGQEKCNFCGSFTALPVDTEPVPFNLAAELQELDDILYALQTEVTIPDVRERLQLARVIGHEIYEHYHKRQLEAIRKGETFIF